MKKKKAKSRQKSSAINFLDKIDSDADGLSDKAEKKYGTNPFSPDTDKDGLSDLAEIKIYHTDPLKPDTDGDGVSDGEEVKKGFSPLVPNFKDYFIPHKGNDHKPYLLHTKRAIFYSVAFILMKAVVFGFALLLPMQAFLAPDVLAQQQMRLQALVNQLRQEQGLKSLVEEQKLDVSSQSRATDMAENKYFSHIGPNNRDLAYFLNKADYLYTMAGENLAMGFSGAEEVLKAWLKSPLHYQNLIDEDFKETGIGLDSGKYEGSETIFIAQHFGAPLLEVRSMPAQGGSASGGNSEVRSMELSQSQKLAPDIKSDEVLGEKTTPPSGGAEEGEMPEEGRLPEFNKEDSKVFWKYDGRSTTLTVKAYIIGDISQATVYVDNYPIELQKNPAEENLYSGSLSIKEPIDNFFKVVVAPTIVIQTEEGQEITDSIGWYKIKIVSPTPQDKYAAAKSFLPGLTAKVFTASKTVYAIAIVIFSIVLLLSILIEIKKQHPHIIAQTLSVIVLLVILLMI